MTRGPTRRRVISGLAGLGGLAAIGCRDGGAPAELIDARIADARPPTAAADAAADGGYVVALEPAGAVRFAHPPRRFACFHCAEADMAVALGVADRLVAMVNPDQMVDNQRLFYDQLPGVRRDFSEVENLVGLLGADVERCLALDVDLFLMDPTVPLHYFRWKPSDVERVKRRAAPFLGHFMRFARGDAWPAQYPQLGLYDVFGKVADAFRRRERFDAIRVMHDAMLDDIRRRLPPVAERPRVLLLSGASDPARGKFHLMTLDGTAPPHGGNQVKQFHDLGVQDAARGVATGEWGQVDAEGIAALRPDVIVVAWTIARPPAEFTTRYVEPLRRHPLLAKVPAAQRGRIYPGGSLEQGPLVNLFHTELLATQLHPDVFGLPPLPGAAPAKPLFDRARLAQAVLGQAT